VGIFRGITATNVVIWATVLAAVPGWVALGVSFDKSVLAWIAYVWAFVFFAIAWMALFWARVERFQAVLARYLWLVGGPITIGLLIGSMEWLISSSFRSALWVVLPAFALAQLGFAVSLPRLAAKRKEVHELTEENEQVKQLNKNLKADLHNAVDVQLDTKRENTKLKQDLHEAKQECERLREDNNELRNQRDWQIRVRCRKLADGIDRLLKEWDRHDHNNRDALRKYNNELKSDANRLINEMRNFGLPQAKVDDPKFLENPENRQDVQNLHDYLRWVHLGWPK
jgi:hypothetical protein